MSRERTIEQNLRKMSIFLKLIFVLYIILTKISPFTPIMAEISIIFHRFYLKACK